MTAAYVDPIAVERAVAGDQVRLTALERRAAGQQLSRYGWSARLIAERLHVSPRTVVRYRRCEKVMPTAYGR